MVADLSAGLGVYSVYYSCILHTLVLYLDLATVRADLQAASHDPSPF